MRGYFDSLRSAASLMLTNAHHALVATTVGHDTVMTNEKMVARWQAAKAKAEALEAELRELKTRVVPVEELESVRNALVRESERLDAAETTIKTQEKRLEAVLSLKRTLVSRVAELEAQNHEKDLTVDSLHTALVDRQMRLARGIQRIGKTLAQIYNQDDSDSDYSAGEEDTDEEDEEEVQDQKQEQDEADTDDEAEMDDAVEAPAPASGAESNAKPESESECKRARLWVKEEKETPQAQSPDGVSVGTPVSAEV